MANHGRVCGAEVVRSNLINRPFADFIFLTIFFTCKVLMSLSNLLGVNIWQGWGVANFGRALVCGAKVVGSNLINRPFADL